TAIVSVYAQKGYMDEARSLFEEMPERNAVSWNAMIKAYDSNGFHTEALDAFQTMNLEGAPPDEITLMTVLSACSHVGSMSRARQVFVSMVDDFRVAPSKEHYSCVIDMLGRAGKMELAEEIVTSMPISPSTIAWGALLGACRIHQDMERARFAAGRAMEIDSSNPSHYLLLSTISSQCG
ncbi:hypothetical protein SELMODRAFT_72001, partial [Selaginella moellendorffii]